MLQNIILTQALNYLINKRASLELKSHWNNINMTSSIHKSILRCDIIGLDQWFADSKEMCIIIIILKYLNINRKLVDMQRSKKKETKIKGCMLGHLFVYEPNSTKILMNRYL